MTTIDLVTCAEYDFSHAENVSAEEKLAMIKRYERQLIDVQFVGTMTFHCNDDADNSYFEFEFGVEWQDRTWERFLFQYDMTRRTLYFVSHVEFGTAIRKHFDVPPYELPIMPTLGWLANEGSDMKFTLAQAASFASSFGQSVWRMAQYEMNVKCNRQFPALLKAVDDQQAGSEK